MTGLIVTRNAQNLVRVGFDDGDELTGTTSHPVWSLDRLDWAALGDLRPGERVQASDREIAVSSVEPFTSTQTVYNLEVHCQHVYAAGHSGVLVHNTGPGVAADCTAWRQSLDAIKNNASLSPVEKQRKILEAIQERRKHLEGLEQNADTAKKLQHLAAAEKRFAKFGKLEGERGYKVFDPKTGNEITDIDHIKDGILWEEKLDAKSASNIAEWVQKQIMDKFENYLTARALLDGYQKADIGFRFNKNAKPAFKKAIIEAIERLQEAYPFVVIHVEWVI